MAASFGAGSMVGLFVALALLAALPSVSVLAVSARAATFGFGQGALTAAGIVAGDLVFILLAVFGLSLLAEAMGPAFVCVKYAAGAYLLWLSAAIWRARKRTPEPGRETVSTGVSSFATGLLITLGDQKAVLFYLGLLPAFIDLTTIGLADIAIITGVTIVAVGGAKLGYAYAAARMGLVFGRRMGENLNILAALVMLAAGLWVILRA